MSELIISILFLDSLGIISILGFQYPWSFVPLKFFLPSSNFHLLNRAWFLYFQSFYHLYLALKLPLCLSFYLYVDSESQSPTNRTFDNIIMYSVESYEPYEIPYIQSPLPPKNVAISCGSARYFYQRNIYIRTRMFSQVTESLLFY